MRNMGHNILFILDSIAYPEKLIKFPLSFFENIFLNSPSKLEFKNFLLSFVKNKGIVPKNKIDALVI